MLTDLVATHGCVEIVSDIYSLPQCENKTFDYLLHRYKTDLLLEKPFDST